VHFSGDAPPTTARLSHCARGPSSRHGQKLRPDVFAFGDVNRRVCAVRPQPSANRLGSPLFRRSKNSSPESSA
jgi:hypothetical protein